MTLALGVASPAVVMAGPKILTESKMDGVTAGGIRVDAIAFAQASGQYALAQTRSDALVTTISDRIEFGVGLAEGLAFACCSRQSEVTVSSTASSTGQIVQSKTYAFKFRGAIAGRGDQVRYFAYGYTAAYVAALSRGDSGQQTVRDPWSHLGRSVRELIDVGRLPLGDGVVTGFEFAPVFAAGLRWRVVRDLLAMASTSSLPTIANLRTSPARFTMGTTSGVLR